MFAARRYCKDECVSRFKRGLCGLLEWGHVHALTLDHLWLTIFLFPFKKVSGSGCVEMYLSGSSICETWEASEEANAHTNGRVISSSSDIMAELLHETSLTHCNTNVLNGSIELYERLSRQLSTKSSVNFPAVRSAKTHGHRENASERRDEVMEMLLGDGEAGFSSCLLAQSTRETSQ